MLKVLIAVDGSEHSSRAIEAVAMLVRSTVTLEASLINVSSGAILEPLFTNDYSQTTLRKLEAEREELQTALLNKATQLAREQGLLVGEPIRAYGNASLEIVRAANERQASLIVMGTRGMGALKSLLMGSVAQKVLHESSVPVLLVK